MLIFKCILIIWGRRHCLGILDITQTPKKSRFLESIYFNVHEEVCSGDGGVAQAVKYLPSDHKALRSNPVKTKESVFYSEAPFSVSHMKTIAK
jgi:hypothetical protein